MFRMRFSLYLSAISALFLQAFSTFLLSTWIISPTCIFSIVSVFYSLTKSGNSNSGRRKISCAASDCWLSFIYCQIFNDTFSDLSGTVPDDRLIDES